MTRGVFFNNPSQKWVARKMMRVYSNMPPAPRLLTDIHGDIRLFDTEQEALDALAQEPEE